MATATQMITEEQPITLGTIIDCDDGEKLYCNAWTNTPISKSMMQRLRGIEGVQYTQDEKGFTISSKNAERLEEIVRYLRAAESSHNRIGRGSNAINVFKDSITALKEKIKAANQEAARKKKAAARIAIYGEKQKQEKPTPAQPTTAAFLMDSAYSLDGTKYNLQKLHEYFEKHAPEGVKNFFKQQMGITITALETSETQKHFFDLSCQVQTTGDFSKKNYEITRLMLGEMAKKMQSKFVTLNQSDMGRLRKEVTEDYEQRMRNSATPDHVAYTIKNFGHYEVSTIIEKYAGMSRLTAFRAFKESEHLDCIVTPICGDVPGESYLKLEVPYHNSQIDLKTFNLAQIIIGMVVAHSDSEPLNLKGMEKLITQTVEQHDADPENFIAKHATAIPGALTQDWMRLRKAPFAEAL